MKTKAVRKPSIIKLDFRPHLQMIKESEAAIAETNAKQSSANAIYLRAMAQMALALMDENHHDDDGIEEYDNR